jgi:hypothetical protein
VYVSDAPLRTQLNEGDALSTVDRGGNAHFIHKRECEIAIQDTRVASIDADRSLPPEGPASGKL